MKLDLGVLALIILAPLWIPLWIPLAIIAWFFAEPVIEKEDEYPYHGA